ncbi:MAG: hypothetical protein PHO46_08240 [Thermoguttaceae bacterium]|jgi:hypothetical protein|nr:hypothetical protein [Thermoguttaceae bacterium]
MPISSSRHTSVEVNELINFSETLNLTDEQKNQLDSIIQRLDNAFEVQRSSLCFLRKCFEELKHSFKGVLFDLEATRLERNRYMHALAKSNKSDRSN